MPKLLRPVSDCLRQCGVNLDWKPRFDGRPELLKGFPKVAQINAKEGKHTFALIDYHPRVPQWQTVEQFRQGVIGSVDRADRGFAHLHFAVHDIEAWIMCDRCVLMEKLDIPEDKLEKDPETIDLDRPPKTVIQRLHRERNRKYRETLEGVDLLSSVSIARLYASSKHFKRFVDDVAQTFSADFTSLVSAGV